FEHRDQMGNVKAIRSGDIQWMSTGYGVVHSEMPLVDESDRIHGFQIWLNMPASEKLRPARYYDSTESGIEELTDNDGNKLRVLAGQWGINGNSVTANLDDLAGDGGVADVRLQSNAALTINLPERERVLMLVHTGSLDDPQLNHGTLIHLESNQEISVTAGTEGLGALIFYGNPINEQIAHMGPFVMNTQAELQQAIADYQSGKFGQITV
ncbi:MAG: pirin family protein, partial [Gammaproteobacteria bacterium]|nr:pirin family protein [Gammaproteobacteria bacterium]